MTAPSPDTNPKTLRLLVIFKLWLPLITLILTVIVLVYSERRQTAKVIDELGEFEEAITTADTLREVVTQPLEGRWEYSIDWDSYYDFETAEDEDIDFVSDGVSFIQWDLGTYHFLVGYENRSRVPIKYVVSVNEGTLSAKNGGLPPIGAKINMSYSHRLGLPDQTIRGRTVDFSKRPEDKYAYVITGYDIDPRSQLVTKIRCTLEIPNSRSAEVIFSRK